MSVWTRIAAILMSLCLLACRQPADQDGQWADDIQIPGVPVTPPEPVSSVTFSYHESPDELANPERGFYHHNEYSFKNGKLPEGTLYNNSAGNTLALTLFYLTDFVEQEHIGDDALARIGDVFSQLRKAGKKAVVRFAYAWDSSSPRDRDPSVTNLKKHIGDLAPVLSANADVIYVVQAGFIGLWGEWHGSTHFGNGSGGHDWSISGSQVVGFENRRQVLDAILAAVPASRQVALRTPYYKRYYLSPDAIQTVTPISAWGGTDANSRISFHNDAFRGSKKTVDGKTVAYDYGTFESQLDRDMWESQSAWLAVGGETAYVDPGAVVTPYADVDSSLEAIKAQHISYLNDNPSNEIMKHWIAQGGREQIRKALGYRLWLREFTLQTPAAENASPVMTISVKLQNSGAAPVINERPMKLLLLDKTTNKPKAVLSGNLGDVRNVSSGGACSFSVTVRKPAGLNSGDMLALWLPDAAASLESRSAYAIRLANTGSSTDPAVSGVSWVTSGDDGGYNVFYTFP